MDRSTLFVMGSALLVSAVVGLGFLLITRRIVRDNAIEQVAAGKACQKAGLSGPVWLNGERDEARRRKWLGDDAALSPSEGTRIFFCTDPQGRLQDVKPPCSLITHVSRNAHSCDSAL